MRVFHSLNNLPTFRNAVLTIGSFDGVHAGHQQIIERINALAAQHGGESVLITFHPHPRLVLNPNDNSLKLITSINEKIEVLRRLGVGNLVIVPFTKDFSEQSPLAYIRDFLVKNFQPHTIVIGYDHRFGKGRAGDLALLRSFSETYNYAVEEIEKQAIADIAVSSTKIREALAEGDIVRANAFLKYPFLLSGKVIHGKKIGTEIGYPTANLEVERQHKIIPKVGIYAVLVRYNEQRFKAMLYIGNRPTLNGQDQSIEVNLFDFEDDLYGKMLYVEFVARVRDDARFENLTLLKQQIAKDKIATLQLLEHL
jgi:riboflavin kinase / FMN adenylyltransferase